MIFTDIDGGHSSKSLDISVSQRRVTGIPGFIFIRSIFILRGSIPLFLPRSTPTPTPRLYARFSRLNFAYSIPCSLCPSSPSFAERTSRLSFRSRRREGTPRAHRATFFSRLRIRLPWKGNAASSSQHLFFSDYFLPFVISSLSFRRPFLSLARSHSHLRFSSSLLKVNYRALRSAVTVDND